MSQRRRERTVAGGNVTGRSAPASARSTCRVPPPAVSGRSSGRELRVSASGRAGSGSSNQMVVPVPLRSARTSARGGGGGGGGGGFGSGRGEGGGSAVAVMAPESSGPAPEAAASGGGTTRRMAASFESKRALIRMKLQKAANAKLHEGKESHLQRGLPKDLQDLVDVDGDGSVDNEEFKLMRSLMKITKDDIPDVDGDGTVCDDELLLARQVAGKRMLAANFVERNMGRMWRYGPEMGGAKSAEECVDTIVKARNYRGLMHFLHDKERIDRVSGSAKVQELLRHPVTDRPATFRPRIYDQFKHTPIS